MKKQVKEKISEEEKKLDYSQRLAELEAELGAHPSRDPQVTATVLPSLSHIQSEQIRGKAVIQFSHKGKTYSVGHTDVTFPGTHEARGIRTVHFYDEDKKVVLGACGEFEDRQLGANFSCRDLKTYLVGPWEESFLTITTGLRTIRADRKEELRKLRARGKK